MEHIKREFEKWTSATFKKRQLLNVLTRWHFIKVVTVAGPTRAAVHCLLHELLLRWRHRLNRRCRLLAHHLLAERWRGNHRLRWHRVHGQWKLALKFTGCRGRRCRRRDSLMNDIVWLVKVAVLRGILMMLLRSWRWILTLENRWNAWGDVQVVEWIWLGEKLEKEMSVNERARKSKLFEPLWTKKLSVDSTADRRQLSSTCYCSHSCRWRSWTLICLRICCRCPPPSLSRCETTAIWECLRLVCAVRFSHLPVPWTIISLHEPYFSHRHCQAFFSHSYATWRCHSSELFETSSRKHTENCSLAR